MKLVLTGGFLGSGKTTAIVRASQQLLNANVKVGVITNDQGEEQVDHDFVKSIGIPSAQVSNGCFCCNYGDLEKQITHFIKDRGAAYLFAESVGSCTDLVATIANPLRKFMPEVQVVISVFADAEMLIAIFENRLSFLQESVRYLYKKQIAEADLLVVNKTDLVNMDQLKIIDQMIKVEYPEKNIIYQNSTREQDIAKWIAAIDSFKAPLGRTTLNIDYDQYAEGEAALGWLDKRLSFKTTSGNALIVANKIVSGIIKKIRTAGLPIGHVKFFVEYRGGHQKLSFTTMREEKHLMVTDHVIQDASMLINARVHANPVILEKLVNDAILAEQQIHGCVIATQTSTAFQPGYPEPTYRFQTV
jgi:Ni2+-binding GTPase involved in maturation of urease and hydrogenase